MLVVSFDVAHAERLPVRSYTSADGLGSNFINFLMRDSHGFLWFCTRDGLSRFDGSRFVTYRVGDKRLHHLPKIATANCGSVFIRADWHVMPTDASPN